MSCIVSDGPANFSFGYFSFNVTENQVHKWFYIALRLERSFKKFYDRYQDQDLIEKYQRLVKEMVNDSLPG